MLKASNSKTSLLVEPSVKPKGGFMKYKIYSITEKIAYHRQVIEDLQEEIERRTQRVLILEDQLVTKNWNKGLKTLKTKKTRR